MKLVHKDSEIDHELAVLMAAKLHNLSLVVRLPPPRHLWSVTWLYDGGDIRSWLVQGNGDTAPCAQDGCPCPAGNLPQLGQKGCLPVTSTLHGFWQMTEGVDRLDSLFQLAHRASGLGSASRGEDFQRPLRYQQVLINFGRKRGVKLLATDTVSLLWYVCMSTQARPDSPPQGLPDPGQANTTVS